MWIAIGSSFTFLNQAHCVARLGARLELLAAFGAQVAAASALLVSIDSSKKKASDREIKR